jgi:glutathionylspermidine synthase
MASGLFDMLSELAKNSQLLASFKANPDAVMEQYGLTAAQKEALKQSFHKGKHHHFYSVVSEEAQQHFADPDVLLC